MNVAKHLERHLGPMERGWSCGSPNGVQVCLFRDQPIPGVITLATLGLSNTVLAMSENRRVREELVIAVRDDRLPEEFAKLLIHVAEGLSTTGRALLRGDIIRLGSRVAADSAAHALYASIPVAFSDALATLRDSIPPTVVVWLIPLLPAEVTFIESLSWSEFEDLLESADPDLFDLGRDSVV